MEKFSTSFSGYKKEEVNKFGFIEMLLNEATAYSGLAVQAPTIVCYNHSIKN